MPVISSFADSKNFSVTGDAGYEGAEFSVTALNDTSVMLEFDNIGTLPAYSSVIVNADNMISLSAKALDGLSSAIHHEPDLRPKVSGIGSKVKNEDIGNKEPFRSGLIL